MRAKMKYIYKLISFIGQKIFLYSKGSLIKVILALLPLKNGTVEKGSRAKDEIIISLTSYPERFKFLEYCLKSILYQTKKPDRIIVWLGNDTEERDLTEGMKKLKKYGVEYRFIRDENMKSHKKYLYAFEEYKKSIVITIDDDEFYSPFLISGLLKTHKRYPKAVCARRVHRITSAEGKIKSYLEWDWAVRGKQKRIPSYDLIAIGVGGVLYPPNCLNGAVQDKEMIRELCFNADDIWLKCMGLLNGTKTVWSPCLKISSCCIPGSQKNRLSQSNVENSENDLYIKNVCSKYQIDKKFFSQNVCGTTERRS